MLSVENSPGHIYAGPDSPTPGELSVAQYSWNAREAGQYASKRPLELYEKCHETRSVSETWTNACVHTRNSPRKSLRRLSQETYEDVFKSFRTESITEYTLTTINTRWEATQRVMAPKLTRLTHKIAIQLHLVAESYTIFNSRSRWPLRKLLDTPSCVSTASVLRCMKTLTFRS
jgi:hypothetical protein